MSLAVWQLAAADRERWAALRGQLWPEDVDRHLADLDTMTAQGDLWGFVAEQGGRDVGYAELALRRYANGCENMPVAFLEGIWTDGAHRRQGIGAALIAYLADFCKAKGLTEICSDALIDNAASHAAHEGWGFQETERVVYFRKAL